MKSLKIAKQSLLLVCILISGGEIKAQVLSNGTVSSNISAQNPFFDASSSFDFSVDPSSSGKGLVFPRTDLTKWSFYSDMLDGISFPTYFDGMIVYNTGTGATPTTGNNPTTSTNVTPGFYFFSNPGAVSDYKTGQWKALTFSIEQGTAGQVLTSAGNGTPYWATQTLIPDDAGANGKVLTSSGTNAPTWETPSSGGVTPVNGILNWDGTGYNPYVGRSAASDGTFYIDNNNTVPIMGTNVLNYGGSLAAYSGFSHALMGISNNFNGLYARSTNSFGVYAESTESHAIKAVAKGTIVSNGIDASSVWNNGVYATSTYGHGVYANSNAAAGGSSYGLYATSTSNIAAVFNSISTARSIVEFRSANTTRLKINGSGIAQYTADYTASMTDPRMIPDVGKVTSMLAVAGSSIKTVNSNYSVLATDGTILVDATSANVTITLPNAATNLGLKQVIKRIDTSANTIVVNSISGTIDGVANIGINTVWQAYTLQSNGSNWYVIGRY